MRGFHAAFLTDAHDEMKQGVFLQQSGKMPCLRLEEKRATLMRGAAAFVFILCLLPNGYAYAESAGPPADHPRLTALRKLANTLATNVGHKLDDADELLEGASVKDRQAKRQLAGIPDGETLVLQTKLVPQRARDLSVFTAPDPLLGIKQGEDILLDFNEFARITGFGITYSAEKAVAEGWAYREDEPFKLDIANKSVMVNGIAKGLEDKDLVIEGDTLYVSSVALEDWFNVTINHTPQAQVTTIVSRDKLMPTQERILRRDRRAKEKFRSPAEKPRLEQPMQVFTMPKADVVLSQEVRRSGDGAKEDLNRSAYNVLATNEVLGHDTETFISGNNQNPVDQLRLNFVKESENNDLLGPLQAKIYEVGDHSSVRVPYTGGTGLERGVRVSNRSERFTSDTETLIDGNAQPGWDVELYRNDSFVDGIAVGDDGYYSFDNVQLFAGDNRFKIILYGPQGEVREDTRLITVAPNLVGSVKGYYDLSLSQKNEITYRADENESSDTGTPRLTATYDRRVGDNITMRGGLHSRVTRDQRDNYFYSGAATTAGETIYNADLITTSDGPFSTILNARRRIGQHNANASARYNSENFSEAFIDEDTNPRTALTTVGAGLQGPWFSNVFFGTNYDTNVGISRDAEGATSASGAFGLSSAFMGMRFNNRISTQRELTSDTGDVNDDSNKTIYDGSVFGRYKTFQWQSGWGYEIEPDAEPIDYNLRLTERFNRQLSGSIEARHTFPTGISTGTVSANYSTDKATFSPSLSYDSDSNMRAYVSVNFSVAQDPYSGDVIMTSRRLAGTNGGLSVFAYLDKGGDGVFNEGDEPLEDVVINLKQFNRDLITNKEGHAFAYDLSTTRVTDVAMEENTSFEPTWVSGFEGVSFRPRAGDVTRVEFPVIRGAEMDGTVGIQNDNGQLQGISGVTVTLVTPDGNDEKSTITPYDGFYVIEAIRPGVYYVTTNSRQASSTAYRTPEQLVITPEGAQIYGKNITLTRGYDIPFFFSAANTNPALERRTKVLKPEDIARTDIYIRLGNYRSSLAASLAWYKLKLQTRSWRNTLTPVAKNLDTVVRDEKTGRLPLVLKTTQPLRMEEAALLCERLVDEGFSDCGVDVVTTYHNGENAASNAVALPKG